MTTEEYVYFDVETCSSMPAINSDMVDWKVSSVKASVTEYLRKESGDLNEVASDNDDDKDDDYDDDDDDDDDDANSKDVKVAEIGTGEALTMLFCFFSIWVFFHNHSRITGLQGKREGISLSPHYHFHPLHRRLDISRVITTESSPLHIASSRTRTGNPWSPSASR